jgi:Tol biopolymer transport system component
MLRGFRFSILIALMLGVLPLASQTVAQDEGDEWIYFLSERDNNLEIYRMRPDGSEQQNLTNNPDMDAFSVDIATYGFSPDQEWIYFPSTREGNTDIYRMSVDGTVVERLTDDPATDNFSRSVELFWSPDGQWLAFERYLNDQAEVFIMRPDGTEQQNVSLSSCSDLVDGWSPDSQWLTIYTNCAGQIDIVALQVNDPTATLRTFVATGEIDFGRGWTADNQWFYYVSGSNGTTDIYRYDPVADLHEQVTDWTGDESLLVITDEWLYIRGFPNEQTDLFRTKLDGTELEQLTDTTDWEGSFQLTADAMYYIADNEETNTNTLYHANLDGTDPQALFAHSSDEWYSEWLLVGDWLYTPLLVNQQFDIFRLNMLTGEQERLTEAPGNDAYFIQYGVIE